MAALLGGFAISDVRPISGGGYRLTFTTTYTGRHHQVYVGRTLAGYTEDTAETAITFFLQPSKWPQWVQLVSVLAAEQTTNFGSQLPQRPYNVARLGWTSSGWTDARWIRVTAGRTPGGAADSTNVLENVLFDQNRTYSYSTKPLPGSGDWNFKVSGVDNRPDGGNVGTALELTAEDVVSTPPDLLLYPNGSRLQQVTADGITTLSFQYPEW